MVSGVGDIRSLLHELGQGPMSGDRGSPVVSVLSLSYFCSLKGQSFAACGKDVVLLIKLWESGCESAEQEMSL